MQLKLQFATLTMLLFAITIWSCDSQQRKFATEFRRKGGLEVTYTKWHSTPAWQGCIDGNYMHQYEITAGVNKGDVYLCCVPITEFLRESFFCSYPNLPHMGTSGDQKVQMCNLIHPKKEDLTVIPACMPAPLQGYNGSDDPPSEREDPVKLPLGK